jgi:uncharacterized integral membrane protein
VKDGLTPEEDAPPATSRSLLVLMARSNNKQANNEAAVLHTIMQIVSPVHQISIYIIFSMYMKHKLKNALIIHISALAFSHKYLNTTRLLIWRHNDISLGGRKV